MNEAIQPDVSMGAFGVVPVTPAATDGAELRSAAGMLAAGVLQGLKIRHDRGVSVVEQVAIALIRQEPDLVVCWSDPWRTAPVVVHRNEVAHPTAAARRHKARLRWIDVDKLIEAARAVLAQAQAQAPGGGEVKAA